MVAVTLSCSTGGTVPHAAGCNASPDRPHRGNATNGGQACYGCPPPMTLSNRLPRVPAQFRSLYGGLLAISLLFGANFTAMGAVLPQMIRSFDWSYTAAATVLAAGSFGYFGATFASGFLVRRIGLRVTAVVGLVLIAGALALFGATPALPANVLLHGLVGVGSGCVEVVINYGAVRMERDGRSQLMNLLHAAFSVGGMLGPLAAARLLDTGAPWQTVFRIIAAGTALAAVWLALLPFHRLDESPPPARRGVRRAAAAPARRTGERSANGDSPAELPFDHVLVALSVALLFIYVGAEVGVSGWIGEYFVSVLGRTPAQGANLVTLFWGGILAGRLLLAICYTGKQSALAILALAGVAAGGLIVAVTADGPLAAAAGFVAAGFGFSSIYPLVMSIVGSYVPARRQSVVVGFASSGGGIGSLVFPFLVAAVAQHTGIRRGFLLYVALALLLMLLALAAMLRTRAIDRSRS